MEKRPHALLLKFPGTNCDTETARALEAAGFRTETVPFARMDADRLEGTDLVVLSGGFSYGDYIMAGKLARLEIELRLGEALRAFHEQGGYLLGICNGFQILMRLGLMPTGSLIDNTSGRFQCRWIELENRNPDNPFLRMLPERFEFPIAHAEGRFVAPEGAAAEYVEQGLGALTYTEDVNGSHAGIAGLGDETGRVFGLMPHPERFLNREHHYDREWRIADDRDPARGWGYYFFRSLHDSITAA